MRAARLKQLWKWAGLTGLAVTIAGCFYPPPEQAQPQNRDRATIATPYDLTLDAVMQVIKDHHFRVQAQDPTHGIIEAQSAHFTLEDADCGLVGTVAGKIPAEPTAGGSAVYNFYVVTQGREASIISIQAVFSTPIRVPFHPLRNVECPSRGVQEARLIDEIRTRATAIRRPEFKKPVALDSPSLRSESFGISRDKLKENLRQPPAN